MPLLRHSVRLWGSSMEQLLVGLGRAWAVIGLYGAMHPASSSHVQGVYPSLSGRIDREPDKRLLLGVAKDKFLYRDQFLGQGAEVVQGLTERLYVAGIATIVFEQHLSAKDLLLFFHCLRQNSDKDRHEAIQAELTQAGVSGIRIFPYHYKELLSRKTVEIGKSGKDSAQREDYLLRSLVTSDFTGRDEEERGIIEEIVRSPELLTAVLKHASSSPRDGISETDEPLSSSENRISPEVLKGLFKRLGSVLVKLPAPERERVLRSLEAGMEVSGSPEEDGRDGLEVVVAQALAADRSGEEFLDLLGSVLSLENKSSGRLRKIFEALTVNRNRSQPLLTRVSERSRESLRARDFYSLKTWESVERLLLDRTEESYVSKDHFQMLESISEGNIGPRATRPQMLSDPALIASLSPAEQQVRNIEIMLELLMSQANEETLSDFLGEFRKIVPNLVSRMDLPLLKKTLHGLLHASGMVREEWKPAIREILKDVDYGQLVESALQRSRPPEQRNEIQNLLTLLAPEAIDPLLERLLNEEDLSRRRSMIRMAVAMGPPAVPALLERFDHPKWYFVRNLCSILGDIGDQSAVPGLLRLAAHPDYRVRREAVAALGRLRPPEAVPALGMLLSNESLFRQGEADSVRIAAALTLHSIGGTEAESYLHLAADSRRPAVRAFCRKLISHREMIR